MIEVNGSKSQVGKSTALGVLVALLLGFSFPAEAQQPKKIYRVGYLSSLDPARESARSEAIRLALREVGYIEGQNIAIEYRYAEGTVIGPLHMLLSWCVSRLTSLW